MDPDKPSSLLEFAALLADRHGCGAVRRVDGVTGESAVATGDVRVQQPGVDSLDDPAVTAGSDAVVLVDLDVALDGGESPHRAEVLARWLRAAPYSVASADPAAMAGHLETLDRLATRPAFRGGVSHGREAGSAVAVFEGSAARPRDTTPPPEFTVVAFVTVYNEEDILEPILDDLAEQGVQAYVLDNWSTDDSWDIVQSRLGNGVLGAERWPAEGRPEHFDLRASLSRVETLAGELRADWYLKHDADEIRRSPWDGVTLREAMWSVQLAGYNVLDFTVINYPPTDGGFHRGVDPWEHFRYFEFGSRPGHFRQFKAWRNFGQEISYASSGSHQIDFEGARVFPYKFELHHYPLRSQEHGLRKVLQERMTRYLPSAKKRGWHNHYDHISEETNLVRDPADLFDRSQAWEDLLVERLSGAGLPRQKPARSGKKRPGAKPAAKPAPSGGGGAAGGGQRPLPRLVRGLSEQMQRMEQRQQRMARDLAVLRNTLQRTPSQTVELSRAYERWVDTEPPMPELGGWALGPPTMLWLLDHLRTHDVSTVLECGSGSSTVWVAAALQKRASAGRVVALESGEEYAAATRSDLERHGLADRATVLTAPLVETPLPDRAPQRWFDLSGLESGLEIDLLLVDGPPGPTGPDARYPAFPLLADRLAVGGTVLLDDVGRPEEDRIAALWVDQPHGGRRLERVTTVDRTAVFRVRES